jgi:peptide/nickel transport system ATP-binding protein
MWVDYKTPSGWMPAVRGATMEIRRGEAVALIGESGSGKSTLGFALLRMLARSARISRGSVRFTTGKGQELDLLALPDKEFRKIRWQEIAMTFQAAQNSLNPVMRVKDTFLETARAHGIRNRNEVRDRTLDLLAKVQLDPDRVYNAYPHELSGGMRQRALIAMALSCEPRLLICDEPTSALDRRAEAGILELLHELRSEVGMGILLVTHDLGAVARSADRVAVMRDGRIVEEGPVAAVLSDPRDRHTSDLLDAVPWLGGSRRRRLPGSLGGAEAPRPGEVHTS